MPFFSPSLPLVTTAAATIAALAAAWGVFRARGSTAMPAAWWSVAACLALALEGLARLSGMLDDRSSLACGRLVVASLAVCPAMSLLGAKRPQHGVWQLIVASLAIVVSMPALSAALIRPGSMPDVHIIGRSFLAILAVVGWMNFVGTRQGLAATLLSGGMIGILWPFMPGVASDAALPQDSLDAVAAGCVAAGAILACLPRAADPAPGAGRFVRLIDRPFLALRDTLGAAWALRIAERFDGVATTRGWPCRLSFRGIEIGGDPADAGWQRDALRAFKALMRRFVSDAWLARHGWEEEA
jgi:hypothetical protein